MKRAFISVLSLALLLCVVSTQGARAEASDSTQAPSRFVGLDATKSGAPDATIAVIIQSVRSTHVPGEPTGTTLSALNPGGPLFISVGPYLTQEMLQSLAVGASVKVTGKMLNVHGQDYFFARQLLVNGQQIVIRNDNGSLVRHLAHPRANSQTSNNGELK